MRRVAFILILVSLLCGCGTIKTNVQIEDKDFADLLFVQKVENNFTSDKLAMPISNQTEIRQVLSMVDGLDAKKIDNDELINILEKQDNYYMFAFFESEESNPTTREYRFQVLEDGTILFDVNKIGTSDFPLVTTDTHNDLLEEMKEMLEINF
ncbi:hypothetical protein SH601_10720 [Gracilibacillus sp. S3-1-1]|uniref:Uncharacterized protein n=1 Tax=Gracilibacillus pellucidus TaxID=3095368 RepID=A0ACC6M656_9BACI|nr:hypothetical protein [Gracilibacillus sp. S3-1-1]MDX8046455.1 hypothetical protein [Gracilibacillus sp. S3-1-1]